MLFACCFCSFLLMFECSNWSSQFERERELLFTVFCSLSFFSSSFFYCFTIFFLFFLYFFISLYFVFLLLLFIPSLYHDGWSFFVSNFTSLARHKPHTLSLSLPFFLFLFSFPLSFLLCCELN